MTREIDQSIAIKVIEAFEKGRLDYLFREANIHYFDREGFDAVRFSSGLPREAIWRLMAAVRHATGLLVFESAWGDVEVRLTLTAQLQQALFEIDTWHRRSLFGTSGIPVEEERIVQDRLLVEEAVLIALSKRDDWPPSRAQIDEVRTAVIAAVYDEVPPKTETDIIATRFYQTTLELPTLLNQPLTPELIAQVHCRLTDGGPCAGRFRTTDQIQPTGRHVVDGVPPERIESELKALCAYAESEDIPFVHPLVKTLAIAWWLRHIQPFGQYNYLVSRLVSMGWILRQGYQLQGIADPALRFQAYGDATGDVTTRVIRQLEIVRDAKLLAEEHLQRRIERYKEVMQRFGHLGVNHRQAFVLDRAMRDPGTTFSIKHHARTRYLAYETARQDLLKLAEMGLLEQYKRGRAFEFRLSEAGARRLGTTLR